MKYYLLSLFTIVVLSLNAQSWVSIGPRAGINITKINSDNTDTEAATGLVAGITSTFSIREHSGLTVEALYSTEGAEMKDGSTVELDYLRIPVFFDIFFRDYGDTFRPKIYAGVVPGVLLKGEVNEEIDISDVYNNFDLGLGAGVGFNYQLAERTWLNADARYVRGITDVNDSNAVVGEGYNSNVPFSLGLAFGL